MMHVLAWMLVLSAPPPGAMPELVAVVNRDYIDHEACHAFHAQLRNQYGKPTVYLGGGLAAVVDEPPVRLSEVASAVVDAGMRGPSYDLYLVQAQRWWDRQPTYILDEGAAYLAGTQYYVARGRTSDAVYSAARARELSRYASVLLRLARTLPGYDSRQLAAIIEYQWMRVGSLPMSSAGATHTPIGQPGAAQAVATQTFPREQQRQPHDTAAVKVSAPPDDFVIVWSSKTCSPCRTYLPLWNRLRSRGATVYELDIDSPPADWAHLRPASVPQVRVYRGGKRVGLWNGAGFDSAIESVVFPNRKDKE
jgi:thiol-disulfide isomerase/thioredoxin